MVMPVQQKGCQKVDGKGEFWDVYRKCTIFNSS
jgi:hypothetical protein